MTIDPVPALGAHDEVGSMPLASAGVPGADFGRALADGLQSLDRTLQVTQSDLQALALGEAAQLHEVMVRLESSRIALQFAMQVRSRALEAYQDVMRMQL